MSGESGSVRWVWGAALVLIVAGVVSVATAVAAYAFWWRSLQQADQPQIPSPTPPPLPAGGGEPAVEAAPPPPADAPGVEPEPVAPGLAEAGGAASPPAGIPVARSVATPLPAPAPPVARGTLLVEIEAAQDPHSPDAVAAMRFEVRLDGQRIGTVGVQFGARGVQRQNGRGRAEIEGLPTGAHELTIAGGPEGGSPVRGTTRVVLEAGRNRAYARVRYLSATDREVRFR
jgi:hypothetical protein